MIFLGGRSVARLPKLTLQWLGNRRRGLSSSCVERVPTLHDVFQPQHHGRIALIQPSFRRKSVILRAYAQKAVSRPKAHTGRTTTAARKAPTTSKTKAAKKPAPKKTTPKPVPKAKSKAKPRIKAKPKPAKKKRAKAKPKPKPKPKKPKKVLTEAQKSGLTKKELKATALKPPQKVVSSTWGVFLAEKMKANGSAANHNLGGLSKEASADYKQLTPEELEHYNHLANQNKIANANSYRQWIESHTPAIIHKANLARLRLRKLEVNAPQLQDHRQVKGLRVSYNFFYQERIRSGDLRGLKIGEGAKLIGREWKALSASEKKPFEDLAAQDLARYTQERKTVLNKDVIRHSK